MLKIILSSQSFSWGFVTLIGMSAKPPKGALEALPHLQLGQVIAGDNTPPDFLSIYGGQILELNPDTLPSTRRWQRIEAALKADKVCTVGQLIHHYQATGNELARLAQVEHLVQPVHMRKTVVKVRFCALKKSDLTSRPHILAHIAATAEIRMSMGFESEQWTTEFEFKSLEAGSQRPDAVYITGDKKRIAVEYDRGTYNMDKIKDKITTFSRQYDGIIWAVPPPIRIKATNKPSAYSRLKNVRNMIAMNPELYKVRTNILLTTVKWWYGGEIIEE